MADVVLFHHALGLTDGVRAFAESLREAGHEVRTPDLFEGALPDSIEDGLTLVRGLGGEYDARAERAVADLPVGVVLAGFSIGEALAQRFAQTRRGVGGALLYESCLPPTEEAYGPWPGGVPVQVHGATGDEFFGEDLAYARALVESAGSSGELFEYPASAHLFTDSSLATYDAACARQVLERSTAFLDRLGG